MRETDQGTERGTGNGGGGERLKQAVSDEEREEEASSRSIAKHWAELVYRRMREGERASGSAKGEGGGGGLKGTRRRRGALVT
jgi:hypothetical protein